MALTNFPNGISSFGIPVYGNAYASYFGTQWFVDTVNGADGNNGKSPTSAFQTLERALYLSDGETANVGDNDTVWVVGTVREQLIAPLGVTGVAIRGMAQGGVRDDNGAKWTYPSSGAVAGQALIRLREQGWCISGFLMTPEPTSGAAIELRRAEDADNPDASHAIISGNRFVGIDVTTTYGVRDIGGCSAIQILGNEFYLCTTGIYNASTAIAVPLRWQVIGNRFIDNTNHISMSATDMLFKDNDFLTEATVNIDLIAVAGQGATNVVTGNVFHNAAADITISDGYQGAATDVWAQNYATDQAVFGVPA